MSSSRLAKAVLVEGPVGPSLLRLAGPMIAGIVAIMLFNLVDTFYVGRLGAYELAAMSFTFPVSFLFMGVSMGMGIGTSAVISRAIGTGNQERVRRLATDSLLLSVAVVTMLGLVGIGFLDTTFLLMGAERDMLPLIRSYMVPWYLGVGFLVIPMVGNSAIRATGDTLTPSLIMIVAGVVNIVVDPLLIFGLGPFPRLGLAGAAIATVFSWALTFVSALYILGFRLGLLDLKGIRPRATLASWKSILQVALPASFTNMLIPVAAGFLTRMLSGFGPEAVAAFGVGTRLESFALVGCMALATSLTPFVGQNFGARRCDRIEEALRTSVRWSWLWGSAACAILAAFAWPLARLFNSEPAVVETTRLFLWTVPLSYGAFGSMMQVTSTYNGLSRPFRSGAVILSRLFVFILPLSYALSIPFGVFGVFAGISAGNMLCGGVSYLVTRRYVRHMSEP